VSSTVPRSRGLSRSAPGALTEPGALLAVTALTAVALALRLSQIHQSLAGDEVFTYQDVVGHSLGAVLRTVNTGGENSPPLFFVLAWLSAKLGNPSEWIRLPSVLLGSAAVPVTYLLGRESVGRLAGLIGAGIMALAPFAVFYGVEARPYATIMFFVALSTLALLRATRSGAPAAWWVLYALAAAAAAYSHYTAIFVLAVQALWSLWLARERIRIAVIANLGIAVLYLPWLPHVRGKALAVIGRLYPLGVHRVLTDLLRPIPGHPAATLREIPTIPGLVAFLVCVLAGLVAMVIRWRVPTRPSISPQSTRLHWSGALSTRSLGGRRPSGHLVGLVALTLATPVGLLVYSLVITDLWLPRGLSASMPAAALVIGALLAALPLRLTALTAAVVVVVLAAGTARSLQPAYTRGPFRAIAGYLDRVAGPRDPVAVVTLAGGLAIPEQLARPHRIVYLIRNLWPNTPPGARAYLVLDLTIGRIEHLGIPGHPGFQLVARRLYSGASATEVLVYRRSDGQ
jgi:4-amino-4-deoxy-L-arabinose transferase-like glycosyltransferase